MLTTPTDGTSGKPRSSLTGIGLLAAVLERPGTGPDSGLQETVAVSHHRLREVPEEAARSRANALGQHAASARGAGDFWCLIERMEV